MMRTRRQIITNKIIDVEPQLYLMLFKVDNQLNNTYSLHTKTKCAYSLQDAVNRCNYDDKKFDFKSLYSHQTITVSEIQKLFKNVY